MQWWRGASEEQKRTLWLAFSAWLNRVAYKDSQGNFRHHKGGRVARWSKSARQIFSASDDDFHDAAHLYRDGRWIDAGDKAHLYCYVAVPENPAGQRLCVVSWGRMGYRVASEQWGDKSEEGVVRVAEEANDMLRVSPERAAEMVHRSVHGWAQDLRDSSEQSGTQRVPFAHAGQGHIAFVGEYEYFFEGDGLYRASWRDSLGEQGVRKGTRVALLNRGHKWAIFDQVRDVHLRLMSDSKPEGVCNDA